MKKRLLIISIILGVLLIGLVVGVAIYVNVPAKNPKWGIRLEVEHVSSSGLTLHMTRQDDEELDLSTGDPYGLQRWTLGGWKAVEGEFVFNMPAYIVDEDFEYTWKVNWEYNCGKLPMGLYRISKQVDDGKYEYTSFFAPFVVADWWQVLIAVVVTAAIVVGIWWLYHRGVMNKLIALRDNRKQLKRILYIVLVLGFAWLIIDDCKPFIVNAFQGIDVIAQEATSEYVRGAITYKDDGKEETKRRIERDMELVLEKRTIIGWRKVKEFAISKQTLSGSQYFTRMREGDTKEYRLNWVKLEQDISNGMYRIKQKTVKDDTANRDGKEKNGSFYIVFMVKDDSFNPEIGPIKESEQSAVASKVAREMKKDENYHSYYAGCYLKKGNLIVLVTNEYKNASSEVKEFLENEEGVIVRKAKYTYQELDELQDKIWEKREELEKNGDKETLAFLEDFTSSSIDEENNRVSVGIVELNNNKIRKFKKLFGNDKRIEFEMGGYGVLD